MKTLILFILLSFRLHSQFCSPATNLGNITPTALVQPTSPAGNNQRPFYTFNATAYCLYTFSFCGLTTMDTELEILNNVNAAQLYNDDYCGLQSELIWLCPSSGPYKIFITRFPCLRLNNNVRLNYSSTCPIQLGYEDVIEEDEDEDEDEEIITIISTSTILGQIILDDENYKGLVVVTYSNNTKKIILR